MSSGSLSAHQSNIAQVIYMLGSDFVLRIFWFVYLFFNYGVSAAGTAEALLGLEKTSKDRRKREAIANNGWNFPTPDKDLPTIDLVIVAYLPNEQEIIKEQTMYALEQIRYPANKITINIVYNTPKRIEPIESELRNLTTTHSNVRVIKVPHSKSKADNINYFMQLGATNQLVPRAADLTAIYDCDHFPHPLAPRWAAERFMAEPTAHIVQGRCVVYNVNASRLAQIICIEFERIYAIFHPGREQMFDFALFCGSNGYWRTPTLNRVRMDENMLTEDIDSALRAFAIGARAVHDTNVISYEQAPDSFGAFWKQRLRWAQGWTQVRCLLVLISFIFDSVLHCTCFAGPD